MRSIADEIVGTPQAKRDNPPFRSLWHQETFHPITADVLFHIHFRFPDGLALRLAPVAPALASGSHTS